jgi:hypothetical protein
MLNHHYFCPNKHPVDDCKINIHTNSFNCPYCQVEVKNINIIHIPEEKIKPYPRFTWVDLDARPFLDAVLRFCKK